MYNGINNSSNTISCVLQLILGSFQGNHTQIVLGFDGVGMWSIRIPLCLVALL